MKYKNYMFDIEMIIDHPIVLLNKTQIVSSHHTMRGFNLNQLIDIIKLNKVPDEDETKITFIIRGVNF